MLLSQVTGGAGAESQGMGSSTPTRSDSANFTDGSGNAIVARQLLVFAAGDVKFRGLDGVDDTYTFGASVSYPQTINVFTIRLWSTGTTVAAGSVKAIW